MASLYNIEQNLCSLLQTIEDNDGEVTDEQYNELLITEEELKTKLDQYHKAIKIWTADAVACKEEKKRINEVQKKYENRVSRLKESMLDAVIKFGQIGKSNKFIELPTVRLFTKQSKSVVVDEHRVNIFISEFERYIRELVSQDCLYASIDVDMQGILDCINANVRAEYGEDFEPFTMHDLTTIKLTISQTDTVYDLFKTGDALVMYGKNFVKCIIENSTMKEDWNTAIEIAEKTNTSKITLASIQINQNLQMK